MTYSSPPTKAGDSLMLRLVSTSKGWNSAINIPALVRAVEEESYNNGLLASPEPEPSPVDTKDAPSDASGQTTPGTASPEPEPIMSRSVQRRLAVTAPGPECHKKLTRHLIDGELWVKADDLEASPRPEPVAVERLARALHLTSRACGKDSTGCRFKHRIRAAAITREYNALSEDKT